VKQDGGVGATERAGVVRMAWCVERCYPLFGQFDVTDEAVWGWWVNAARWTGKQPEATRQLDLPLIEDFTPFTPNCPS
jgi:hypothetical protein